MHELAISQIPVFEGIDIVGLISEHGIVIHLADKGVAELKNVQYCQIQWTPFLQL